MHASLVASHKTAPRLTKMGMENVKWDPKAWEMKHILNEKTLTIELNDCHPTTEDRCK